MLDKVVIGYAGDQAGRDAVALGARIAGLLGSTVSIVFPYHPLLARMSSDVAETRVREAVSTLTAGIDGFSAATCHWTPSSWPIHGLHEMARCEDAALIVFGSAREGLADHLHVSLMERMVHGAPCSVAVAPARYAQRAPERFLRIGVGFSTSNEGTSALRVAHELAIRAGGELEVIAGAGLEPALRSYAFSSPALPRVEREIHEETEATLQRATAELGQEVPVEHHTISGEPASVLIDRSSEVDILILGSRAYGPVRHVLMGSVSARVMREAHCPVLVVPRGAAGAASVASGRGEGAEQEPAVR